MNYAHITQTKYNIPKLNTNGYKSHAGFVYKCKCIFIYICKYYKFSELLWVACGPRATYLRPLIYQKKKYNSLITY